MLAGKHVARARVMSDMGQPVKTDVAKAMRQRMSGMEIKEIGLRSASSLDEVSSAVPRSWYPARRTGIFPVEAPST